MSDVNLFDLLPASGPELCVQVGGRQHSRAKIRARSDAIGLVLRDTGIEPGAPVGILLPTGADCVSALFAVWRAGGVVVPMNPRGTDTELHRVVQDLDLFAVMTTPEQESRIPGCRESCWAKPARSRFARALRGPFATIEASPSCRSRPGRPESPRPSRCCTPASSRVSTRSSERLLAKPAEGSAPRMPNLIPVPMSVWGGIYQMLFAFRVGARR